MSVLVKRESVPKMGIHPIDLRRRNWLCAERTEWVSVDAVEKIDGFVWTREFIKVWLSTVLPTKYAYCKCTPPARDVMSIPRLDDFFLNVNHYLSSTLYSEFKNNCCNKK
jgi:hypothetical protein